jgi:hypothetical protein
LCGHFFAKVRLGGGARRDQTAGHRHQQRRDGGDQAFADGQDGVGFGRRRQVETVLHHADDQPGNDVDEGDQHGRQRVALGEADGAVHGTVEVGLAPDASAPLAGFLLVDDAGVQIGVDRHLPSGHGLQGEPGRDFRDTDRAVVDDEELDRDQHQEDDDADHEVAADHELSERLDDAAGRLHALAPVQQHQACGGDVERQADEREQQQERGEHRELDR